MYETIFNYLTENLLELIGFIFGVAYVILAIRESLVCWIVGIVNVSLYSLIFFQSSLYGSAALQVTYLIISIYGLLIWLGVGKNKSDKAPVVSRVPKNLIPHLVIASFALSFIFIQILKSTNHPIPYTDGIIAAVGLIGTWMTAKKYLESWLIWIANDYICAIIYGSQGLYLTIVLYLVLGTLAIVGYFEWQKSLKRKLT